MDFHVFIILFAYSVKAESSIGDASPIAWVFLSISILSILLFPWLRSKCEAQRKIKEESKPRMKAYRKAQTKAPLSSFEEVEEQEIPLVTKLVKCDEPQAIQMMESRDEIQMVRHLKQDYSRPVKYALAQQVDELYPQTKMLKATLYPSYDADRDPSAKEDPDTPPAGLDLEPELFEADDAEDIETRVKSLASRFNIEIDRIHRRVQNQEIEFSGRLEELNAKIEAESHRVIELLQLEMTERFEEHSNVFNNKLEQLNVDLRDAIEQESARVIEEMTKKCKNMVAVVEEAVREAEVKIGQLHDTTLENIEGIERNKNQLNDTIDEMRAIRNELQRFQDEERKKWEEEEKRRRESSLRVQLEKIFEKPPVLVEEIWMNLESFFYSQAWLYSTCMIVGLPFWYCLTTIVAMFIILPTCYGILVLGFNKIEKDSGKVQANGIILDKEDMMSRAKRNMTIVLFSFLINLFLIGYPQLMLRVVDNRTAAILVYIGILICIQIFGTYRTYAATYVAKHEVTIHNTFNMWNPMNYMKICSLLYECFQISYYAYFYAIAQGNADAYEMPDWVVNLLLIRISPGTSGLLDFYFTAGMVGALSAILLVTHQYTQDCRDYAIKKYHEGDAVGAREVYFKSFIGTAIYGHLSINREGVSFPVEYGIKLFTDLLYFAIFDKLVMTFSCVDDHMIVDREVKCWGSEHVNLAILALIALGYYVPLCTMITPMFDENNEGSISEIRPYKSFLIIMKSVLILCVIINNTEVFAVVYMCLCCIIVGLTLYGIRSPTLRPMNPHILNFLRVGFYIVGIIGAILVLAKPKYVDFQMTIFSGLIITLVLSALYAEGTPVTDPLYVKEGYDFGDEDQTDEKGVR